jgi:hypothetical protein
MIGTQIDSYRVVEKLANAAWVWSIRPSTSAWTAPWQTGQTPQAVEKLMGKPEDTVSVQESLVYIYPAVKVVFEKGKLVDVQPRKP